MPTPMPYPVRARIQAMYSRPRRCTYAYVGNGTGSALPHPPEVALAEGLEANAQTLDWRLAYRPGRLGHPTKRGPHSNSEHDEASHSKAAAESH
jgi:hypothetical protein